MKRRSHKPRRAAQSRDMLHRAGPVLLGVAIAGAASFPTSSFSSAIPSTHRTSGAVIEAWAFGTLSDATRPNSQAACDLKHVCALAISSNGGTGTGAGATGTDDDGDGDDDNAEGEVTSGAAGSASENSD